MFKLRGKAILVERKTLSNILLLIENRDLKFKSQIRK